MDDALRLVVFDQEVVARYVLILVLMDDALRHAVYPTDEYDHYTS